MPTKRLKSPLVEAAPVSVVVSSRVTSFQFDGVEGDLLPLFYRRAEYQLPAYVVRMPMPTLTCRHLEKATFHVLQGNAEQALLAFRRAVASAIEPMTLIKVALACHTEDHFEAAGGALRRALKYAGRDGRSASLVRAVAEHLAYDLSSEV
ncbi:MAG: hypothetical protein VKP62_01430 [Candidatus Sericytochromatia bacterium]|nr:hypothetical protein [Candidatus Sericytochromatia bacterium]